MGELAAIITAFLWSGTSIAFTEASKRVGSVAVNITRMVFASVLLFFTIIIFDLNYHLSQSQYIYLIISGLIGLVFGDAFLFKAFQYIGARISMLMMSLVPPMSAMLAFIFLDEILSIVAITGIIITLVGVVMVILNKKENSFLDPKIKRLGIIYCFFGAVGQAGGLIFAKFAFEEGDINGFVGTLIRIVPSIIVLWPIAYLSGKFKNPIKIFREDKTALLYTSVGSFIGPFLGITFSLIAVANTYVGIASTLMATVPIIMLPLVKYYYKEKLSTVSIAGAFVAVTGIAVLFLL